MAQEGLDVLLLLGAHRREVAVLGQEKRVGGRDELGFFEVGEVDEVGIIVGHLQQVVLPLFQQHRLGVVAAPLPLPLPVQSDDLEIEETNVIDVVEQSFERVARELVYFAQEVLPHADAALQVLVNALACPEELGL